MEFLFRLSNYDDPALDAEAAERVRREELRRGISV